MDDVWRRLCELHPREAARRSRSSASNKRVVYAHCAHLCQVRGWDQDRTPRGWSRVFGAVRVESVSDLRREIMGHSDVLLVAKDLQNGENEDVTVTRSLTLWCPEKRWWTSNGHKPIVTVSGQDVVLSLAGHLCIQHRSSYAPLRCIRGAGVSGSISVLLTSALEDDAWSDCCVM